MSTAPAARRPRPACWRIVITYCVATLAFVACTSAEEPVGAWGDPIVTAVGNPADLSAPIGAYARYVGRAEFARHRYTKIASGHSSVCGIRTDGRLLCAGEVSKFTDWPIFDNQLTKIGGLFVDIAVDGGTVCGLLADRTLRCGGMNDERQAEPPNGTYRSIIVTGPRACALAADGTLACWGSNERGQSEAPDGTYTQLAANDLDACAVSTRGSIECWGSTEQIQTDAPSGTYTQIVGDDLNSCALDERGAIACWGYDEDHRLDAPAGVFTQVSLGGINCSLSADNRAECWAEWRPDFDDVSTDDMLGSAEEWIHR